MAPSIITQPPQNGTATPSQRQSTQLPISSPTGLSARQAARNGAYTSFTSGLAPSFIQANLIILPSRYATDFRLLCQRNPVPCPLLAESKSTGKWDELKSWIKGVADESIAADVDIRHDAPRYNVYQDGDLVKSQVTDIVKEWTDDHIAFLIGCSFSFESALTVSGLPPRHIIMNRNVPMYRTNSPLCPAGAFTGSTYVVSMRPYKKIEIETVRDVTRPYVTTHGEPIAWGWDAVRKLGIKDINVPEWGDAPLAIDGRAFDEEHAVDEAVPVFWGCGVTPQEAVMRANVEGTVMGHAPGHMLVLDVKEEDLLYKE
jgi:uncharacterized protein YcsI (UPF0317 family)